MGVHYGDKETMLSRMESNIGAVSGMQNVDRQHFEDFENYEYPGAFINDVGEARTRVLKNVTNVLWTMTVIAFDYSEAEDLSTKLNSLIKLVKAKILSDITLNGQGYNTKIIRIDTDEGFLFPHCVGIFILEIVYLEREAV